MANKINSILMFLAIGLLAPVPVVAADLPHWDLDMTGAEYRALRESQSDKSAAASLLQPVLRLGERNLDWLQHINSKRSDPLSFSSKETMRGYPIDQPAEYNERIVLDEYKILRGRLPAAMARVLLDGEPFSDALPLPEKEYLAWGLEIDRVYQSGSRWLMMQPYLEALHQRRKSDVRGHYFLSRLENRDEVLANFKQQSADVQARVREALVGVCYNSANTLAGCEKEVQTAIRNSALTAFYDRYRRFGEEAYSYFFTLAVQRADFNWSEGTSRIPFIDPKRGDVRTFLEDNLHDEWKLGSWNLRIDFVPLGGHPFVVFVPGATPNVEYLGGNRITMDANAPLTEWDVQWTIRHEFGHALGFPDCYVEFYNKERKVIINYQIDVDNLMCSRKGHLQEGHVSELRRVYAE